MQFQSYLTPIIKWWWLILVSTVLALVTCFLVVNNMQPVYTAHTTLIIGKTITNPNPSSNDFWLNQQLASFYMDLSYREPVTNAVKKNLNLTQLPSYTVKPLGNNQFLEIDVTDANPQLAMDVAEELARQIIAISPGGTQASDPERNKFAEEQLAKTQQQILTTEELIAKKQDEMGTIQSARDLENAKQEIKTLQDRLILLQTNYSNLLATSKPAVSNILELIEKATLPTQPSGLNKYLIVALAGAVGLALGVGASYLLEGLDTTLKTPKEVEQVLGLPLVGYLMDMGKAYRFTRYVAEHPRSMYSEAVRTLRANLEIQIPEQELRTLMVTSPDQGDGKSSVSVNLAISLAQGGKRVLLIDTDLRRPTIHKYFEFEDPSGLSEVFEGKSELKDVLHAWGDGRLQVVTAGESKEVSEEFFSPDKVTAFLEQAKELADIVVVDTPPIAISDALIFASKVDGILLVVRPGATNRDLARLMKKRIDDAQGRVLGVVLNGIPITKSGYYGVYRYYIPYYYGNGNGRGAKENGRGKREAVKKTAEKIG